MPCRYALRLLLIFAAAAALLMPIDAVFAAMPLLLLPPMLIYFIADAMPPLTPAVSMLPILFFAIFRLY